VVKTPWCSIIIPTLSNNPPTLKSLPPPEELERLGIELIVLKDMGWRNASRTRNIGAAAARGRVFCFIDDDASLNFHKLLDMLRRVSERENGFVWHDPPHLLIVRSDIFISVGGYDERYKPTMGETIELRLRLLRLGCTQIPFSPNDIQLIHLKEHPNPRYLLNQKHLTWAYLEHRYLPLRKLIWRKNPLEVARRVKWVLEWLLYRRYQRRSILSKR
jgi:glycosyltransferase involved in cell wall biosynthesis